MDAGLSPDHFPNAIARAHRHSALVHDDLVAVHRLGYVSRHAEHLLDVGGTVFARRGPYSEEDELESGPPREASR